MKKHLNKAQRRELKKEDKGIVDFIKVIEHFFKNFNHWVQEMLDPRHTSYTTYTQEDLIHLGILKNICGVESMRQMNERFNEENCIKALSILSGNESLEEIPDYGTLNYYLSKLSPSCLGELRTRMIRQLIRSKSFNRNRLQNKYWRIILDGTGLFYFQERHCEYCLSRTLTDKDGKEKTIYYHHVLEAKLVLSDVLILSIGTEFVENEKENCENQDCELKAGKRLIQKIKSDYPRLQICLLGDSLYAVEPIMKMCRENSWKYIFFLKEGNQKNIVKDYNWLLESGAGLTVKNLCDKEDGVGVYVNGVGEVTGKEEVFNVFDYQYEKVRKGEKSVVRFRWVSNLEVTKRNVEELILCGRSRWKIENEGFNNQKNGIYQIEHLNSRDVNGMKNHYLLTQISDILMQLYLACNKLVKQIGQSIKNTSSRLCESFRRQPITLEDTVYIAKYTTVHLE
jgi:hypothetical protein